MVSSRIKGALAQAKRRGVKLGGDRGYKSSNHSFVGFFGREGAGGRRSQSVAATSSGRARSLPAPDGRMISVRRLSAPLVIAMVFNPNARF